MGKNQEIERKFLVTGDGWKAGATGVSYAQGYLCRDPERTVRVRLAGGKGFLTVKGKAAADRPLTRAEYEYEIPAAEAEMLLNTLCLPGQIRKTRYRVNHGGHIWEVDIFEGENAGLAMAEIELPAEDAPFDVPDWAGKDVSADARYSNAALSLRPYAAWEKTS